MGRDHHVAVPDGLVGQYMLMSTTALIPKPESMWKAQTMLLIYSPFLAAC